MESVDRSTAVERRLPSSDRPVIKFTGVHNAPQKICVSVDCKAVNAAKKCDFVSGHILYAPDSKGRVAIYSGVPVRPRRCFQLIIQTLHLEFMKFNKLQAFYKESFDTIQRIAITAPISIRHCVKIMGTGATGAPQNPFIDIAALLAAAAAGGRAHDNILIL